MSLIFFLSENRLFYTIYLSNVEDIALVARDTNVEYYLARSVLAQQQPPLTIE